MFCYITVWYSVTVMCVCYCNVLLQYSTALLLCVCVLLQCVATVQYSTVQCYCYVCDCNVLLQYSTVQRYCYVCVLL